MPDLLELPDCADPMLPDLFFGGGGRMFESVCRDLLADNVPSSGFK